MYQRLENLLLAFLSAKILKKWTSLEPQVRKLQQNYLGTYLFSYVVHISAILFPRNQVATPKLVNTMSSGIPGPSLGNLFPKLEYWGAF